MKKRNTLEPQHADDGVAASPRGHPAVATQRERRLASILESLHDIVFVLDTDQRHTEIFGTWVEREGITPDFLLGRTAADIFGPELARPHEEANRRALDGETVTYEWSHGEGPDRRWLQTTLSPVRNGRGEIDGIAGVARDISSLRRSEHELSGSNALLTRIAAVQSEFIAESDPGEVFTSLLGHLLELTGSEYGFIAETELTTNGRQALRMRSITNIAWDRASRKFHDDNHPGGMLFTDLDNLFGRVVTTRSAVITNEPDHHPGSRGTPPGHPPLSAFLGLPFFQGSELVGMVGLANRPGGYHPSIAHRLEPILATCSNLITAHRTARSRQRILEALERSEARYQAIFEGAAVSIWELDITRLRDELQAVRASGVQDLAAHLEAHPDLLLHLVGLMRISAVNGETLQLFRATDSQVLLERLPELFTSESLSAFRDAVVRYAESSGRPVVRATNFRALDGRMVDVLVKLNLPELDDRATGVVVSFTDITRLMEMEREREQLIAGLQAALAQVKRLSGLLPICSRCKKIRDDDGYWQDVAVYIRNHSDADLTHGICPPCFEALYGDLELSGPGD